MFKFMSTNNLLTSTNYIVTFSLKKSTIFSIIYICNRDFLYITLVNSTKGTQAYRKFYFIAMNNDGEKCIKIIQNEMRTLSLQRRSCSCNINSTTRAVIFINYLIILQTNNLSLVNTNN